MLGFEKGDGKSILLVVIGVIIATVVAMPLFEWGKKKVEGVVK